MKSYSLLFLFSIGSMFFLVHHTEYREQGNSLENRINFFLPSTI